MIIDVIALYLTRIFIILLLGFTLVMFVYFIVTFWCYFIEDSIPSKDMIQRANQREDKE